MADDRASGQEVEPLRAEIRRLQREVAELRAAIEISPQLPWRADATGTDFDLNARWLQLTGLTSASLTDGGWAAALHPDDLAPSLAAWQRAVRDGAPYDVRQRVRNAAGQFRWMRTRALPLRDEQGRVIGWSGATEDVHELLQADAEARRAAAELEAVYDAAPVGLAVLDPQGRFVRINSRLAALNGVPPADHLGRTIEQVVPDVAAAGRAFLEEVLRTGRPLLGIEISGETPADPGVPHTWLENWVPLFDESGRVSAINVVAQDVTDQRRAEARRQLLARELKHRISNALNVVQVIAQLTFTGASDPRVEQFFERLAALAGANDLLIANSWEATSLRDAIRLGLNALPDAARVSLAGPDLPVGADSVANIVLAIHELGTNSLKYGALSQPQGQVNVTWTADPADPDGRLHWRWVESGGPPVSPPTHQGFGSMMIEAVLAREFEGEVRMHYLPGGLVCELDAPLSGLRDKAGP